MSDIVAVGLPEFKSKYDLTELDSKQSFDGYEVVVFDSLTYLRNNLPHEMEYLSAEASVTANEHLKRRSDELWKFVEQGGLVIYFPHSQLEYKGYLNNSMKNLSFKDLVFEKNLTASVGKKLQVAGKLNAHISTFLNKLQDLLIYRVVLPDYAEYEACLLIKEQSQIVGNYKLHESGGAILNIPTLSFSSEENISTFIDAVYELRYALSPKKQTKAIANIKPVDSGQLPEWQADYLTPAQQQVAESISTLKDEISGLVAKLNSKNAEFKKLDAYKQLITAQGKPLEKIASTVLQSMGLKIEEDPSGDGLIGTYKDQVILIDVNGIAQKSATELDGVHLEKKAAKYFEDNNKHAKSLLIFNGYLDIPLADRPEDIFPEKL
ncbi:MAG: hypothetical protein ACAH10_13240, partial [Methylophilaceae bacterium]